MSLDHMTTPPREHEMCTIPRNHSNQHALNNGPILQGNPFLTGYIECAQEALWYLTQVEQLPLDHPMVMGLQMHLWEQYKMLHLQQMLGNSLRMSNEHEPVIADDNTNIQQNNVDIKSHKELSSAIDHDGGDISGNSAIRSDAFNAKDIEIQQTELREVKHAHVDQPDSELSPEAQQLAETLAEEIYSILNAEHDLDEYDSNDEESDNECESTDEGFEEMAES